MLVDHQNQPHIRAARIAKLVPFLVVLAGLGHAILTQTGNTPFGSEVIGISSARAVGPEMSSPAIEYFPASYVNHANTLAEHIQAF